MKNGFLTDKKEDNDKKENNDNKGNNKKDSKERVDGILVLWKPSGKTSTYFTNFIRRVLREKRVGHLGTLDPIAEGILPILIGNATKLFPYLLETEREYIITILLGIRTDTDDITGKILYDKKEKVDSISERDIEDAVLSFSGTFDQIPPYFSAKKLGGKRFYEFAREGELIEPPPQKVTIYFTEILEIKKPEVKIKVISSPSMYARALARDIGEKLGVGGTMKSLIRTRYGHFKEGVEWEKIKMSKELKSFILPITPETINMREVQLRENDLRRILNGGTSLTKVQGEEGELVAITNEKKEVIAIGKIVKSSIKPERIIAKEKIL